MPDGEEPDEPEVAPGAEGFEATEREEREIAGEAARERSDFLSLMGHLYRGEMSRATSWRSRLDRTSNWAVVVVASLITFAFSSGETPHSIMILGMIVVTFFLVIESRRYRMYDVWRSRVRMLEENVFANALEPSGAEHLKWRSLISQDLRHPKIKITFLEAAGRRLRRMYLALLLILGLAWVGHLSLAAGSPWTIIAAARIWIVPGEIVFAGVVGYFLSLVVLAFWPREREAKGELVYDPKAGEWKEKDHQETP